MSIDYLKNELKVRKILCLYKRQGARRRRDAGKARQPETSIAVTHSLCVRMQKGRTDKTYYSSVFLIRLRGTSKAPEALNAFKSSINVVREIGNLRLRILVNRAP